MMTLREKFTSQRNALVEEALEILARFHTAGGLTPEEIARIKLLVDEADRLNGKLVGFDGTVRETTDAAGPTEFRDAE